MFFCFKKRTKPNGEEQSNTKRELIERYILQSCSQPEESFDQTLDRSHLKIVDDFDQREYVKVTWKIDDWLRMMHTKDITQIDFDELRRNVREGIVEQIRPAIWFWMTDITNQYIKKHSYDIYRKLKNLQSQHDSQLFKDLKDTDRQQRDSMFDIVRAYCNYDNSVGYNKYFITFAQFLYEQLNPSRYNKEIAFIHIPDDEDLQDSSVFWMMIHIFIKLDYRSILINQYSFTVSEKFLNTLTPSVKTHLSRFKCSIDQLFEQPLLLLFHKFLSKKDFLKLFDVFLIEGEYILVLVLLKLLKVSESLILMFQSENDLRDFFNQSIPIATN
ncbi:hypothetical protein pb186bvf_005408 [Paramecium bursaria]